jgi:ABC-2 type transport system permease protein
VLGALVRDVRLSASHWVLVSVSILLGLLPIAALGVLVGYLGTPAALQPVFGLGSALLALLGGMFAPAETFPSSVQSVMHVLPTYWSADAGRAVLRGTWLGMHGVLVLAAWTVALGALAARAYARDQKKG